MKFCPACHNILYTLDEELNKDGKKFACLKCRKCDYKEHLDKNNPIVYEHILKETTVEKLILNPYLKYDPTLPRFTEIVCPSKECGEKEVVGLKVDQQNLIWMYQCVHCDTIWKQSAVN
jgi:DNA-directed RNA polymerase subunit M/transcription elongation factor TFIIS